MIDHDTIYIGQRRLVCPDKNHYRIAHPEFRYAPINGMGYVLAVFQNVFNRPTLWTCSGWILTEDLGFRSVKEWMAANPDWRKPFGGEL